MPQEKVRVRFAPSPTGYLHVGGARTAIFNWLFARRQAGAFVLRIEDTDIERNRPEFESSLLDDLKWLGLNWDEGPAPAGSANATSVAGSGGSFGPYRQSERIALYRSRADRLVSAGKAYPCFCPDDVLEAKRQAALARGASPQYDGACRALGAEEIAERRRAGAPETVRFRVPQGVVRFQDIIRGEIEMATEMVGDFVLIRSNGIPTYNFAAAVDDFEMRITHVLRGEEHLPNTLRQILIHDSLGGARPRWGHLPLILAEDRSKLSKRHGGSTVGELIETGYLPGAVRNYLVLLGWSHPEEKEIIDVDELVAVFTLDRVSKSPAVYDREKLKWMNAQYIRRTSVEALFESADRFFPESVRAAYDASDRKRILALLHEKLETLSDVKEKSAAFEEEPETTAEAAGVLAGEAAARVLDALEKAIRASAGDLTAAGFKAMVDEVSKATGEKGKALYFPIRAALTGSVHGPDLAGLAEIKGRERVLRCIERARRAS